MSICFVSGKFGTAYMSFFRFIRWLMFLNIYIMIVMFCVTTIPFLVLKPESFSETVNKSQSVYHDQAVNCSRNYQDYIDEIKTLKSTFEKVLDFLQGTVSIVLVISKCDMSRDMWFPTMWYFETWTRLCSPLLMLESLNDVQSIA